MKKILFSWWCLVLCFWANAQIITVRDSATSQPLELATLVSEKPLAFTTTNAEGQADISAFKDAEKIEFRSLGYKSVHKSYAELQGVSFVDLSSAGLAIDQVVVSAVKWNLDSREVPSKVSSISQQTVALQNPQTAADMLGISGEVFIQKSQQGGGSPMIRGFATNRLLYTVDGVRMNTAIFRAGNLQNVISLDPLAIENTEVLFGPGSVIYGSDAIGGVMSFRTLAPQLSFTDKTLVKGSAVARFASINKELTGHFDVNVGWKKWSLLTSLTYSDYDDLKMGRNGPDEYLREFYVQRVNDTDVVVTNDDPLVQKPSGYSQINLMQKLRFKPSDKWDFEYALHYSATSDYPRYDRLIRTRNGLPRAAQWYYGPQEWLMNYLSATNTGNNAVYDQLTIRLAHQRFKESRNDRDFNDDELRHRNEEVTAWSANLDFNKSIGNRNKLFYGLEMVIDDVNSAGVNEYISNDSTAAGPSRYPQSTWSSYAAYVAWHWRITKKLLLQAGARYNYFSLDAEFDTTFYPFPFTTADINDGAVTGSLGLAFNPTDKWSLSANFSTGFRSPNVDDVGKVFDSEPGFVVVPNPDLQSEYAYNFEASVSKIFGDAVKLDVTGYYTILQDVMALRDYTLNGQDSILYNGEMGKVHALQNAEKAYVYGVQGGIEVKLPKGFGISSRVNYQKGRQQLEDGSELPMGHVAPLFGNAAFTYSRNKLKLDWYVVYNAEAKPENIPDDGEGVFLTNDDGEKYCPRWYTLNFKAMYQITDNFSVSGGVENITDQRYRPYRSGIAAGGRNFILALRANF